MARRSKVDIYGLVERVLSLYKEGKTITEIEQLLRSEGYDISRESIRRRIKSAKEVAEIYKRSLEEAKILLETVRNNPNTDIVEVTNSLLAHKLFEFAKSVEELSFDNPMTFVKAVREISEAHLRAKLQHDYREAIKKEIMEAVARELQKHPDLKARLLEIIRNVEIKK